MTNTKKIWQRPEMTVLVRSNPEEAVLLTCKRGGVTGPDRDTGNNCNNPDPTQCASNAGS